MFNSKFKKKNNGKGRDSSDMDIVADGYESLDVLAVTKEAYINEYILDFGCSFHITLHQ